MFARIGGIVAPFITYLVSIYQSAFNTSLFWAQNERGCVQNEMLSLAELKIHKKVTITIIMIIGNREKEIVVTVSNETFVYIDYTKDVECRTNS